MHKYNESQCFGFASDRIRLLLCFPGSGSGICYKSTSGPAPRLSVIRTEERFEVDCRLAYQFFQNTCVQTVKLLCNTMWRWEVVSGWYLMICNRNVIRHENRNGKTRASRRKHCWESERMIFFVCYGLKM